MKTATREAFGRALEQLIEKDKNIVVLDADLAPATKTEYAAKKVPERFFSTGIAESNMVGMAAGLAAQGLKPYVSSFAIFLAGRAFEQIRNSVAYPHLNVKLCATHAGLSVGEDGGTHQCIEDIALMRALPQMVVLQPCDEAETRSMMNWMNEYEGPVYVRLGRPAVSDVYPSAHSFRLGHIEQIRTGEKIAMLATGSMVQESLKSLDVLKQYGLKPALYNVSTLKPIDKNQLLEISRQYDLLVTLEEHNVIGGLYSLVSEIVHEKLIIAIGIKDRFGQSGTPEELFKAYGLDKDSIVSKIVEEVDYGK